jgi:hypothetical protein
VARRVNAIDEENANIAPRIFDFIFDTTRSANAE